MRVLGYARTSTKGKNQDPSIEHQKSYIIEFLQKESHELVTIYVDEGCSGKIPLQKRPQAELIAEKAFSFFFFHLFSLSAHNAYMVCTRPCQTKPTMVRTPCLLDLEQRILECVSTGPFCHNDPYRQRLRQHTVRN